MTNVAFTRGRSPNAHWIDGPLTAKCWPMTTTLVPPSAGPPIGCSQKTAMPVCVFWHMPSVTWPHWFRHDEFHLYSSRCE